jgi:hypothetical protein
VDREILPGHDAEAIESSLRLEVDVTFGDDVSGVGGKARMRVNW